MTPSYDQILSIAGAITPPTETGHLGVEWIVPERLAVGRDSENRQVLVFSGNIESSLESVQRALMRGTWTTESGDSIEGTLLRLHAGDEFMVAATTIAVELLRLGLETRPTVDVFPEVERFVELVIRRVLLPPEALLGLIGELIVLELLVEPLANLPEDKRIKISNVWLGQSRSSRDFRLNRLGLEVKTTSRPTSTHHIGGLDQIEPRMLDGDVTEFLFLVSIGLQEDPGGTSRFSVCGLTQAILDRLPVAEHVGFLDQLRDYGPDDCIGYDHATMSTWEPYARGFSTTFPPRVYDMADENIRIFRKSDLQKHFPCVVPNRLSFMIDLPETVPGSHGANPRTGLAAVLAQLVENA